MIKTLNSLENELIGLADEELEEFVEQEAEQEQIVVWEGTLFCVLETRRRRRWCYIAALLEADRGGENTQVD